MKIGAHQPHCFPWLGYLHKIATSDVFVVMDDLQFEAQNYINRNRVKVNNGTTWLQIPLVRGPQDQAINDKKIANTTHPREDWRRKIWVTLKTHYGKAKHFGLYASELERTFAQQWDTLLDFNMHMLRLFTGWLGINTPMVMASTLSLQGQKTDRIVDMIKKVKGSAYYSGKGGSTDYLELHKLEREGIAVEWQDFKHPTYPQRYTQLGFVKNLAAFDLIFNCGPDSRRVLMGGQPSWKSSSQTATSLRA